MKIRRILSWALLTGGLVLLISGSREFLSSIFNQAEIAEEWKPAVTAQSGEQQPPAAPGQPLAKMFVPRLNAELFVVEGTGKRELRRGPGHLEGTALPGTRGNCVIAGHRDTHFRFLKDIREGDEIFLDTSQGQFRYEVTKTEIVQPTNTAPLKSTPGAVLNLVTCYPFYYVGPAPKRFIVRAELATAVRTVKDMPGRPGTVGFPAISLTR